MGNIDYDYLGDGSVAASAVTESKMRYSASQFCQCW